MADRIERGELRKMILGFVREHGPCTTSAMRDAFGIDLDRIGNVLTRLRFDGLVEREKVVKRGAWTWAATGNRGEKGDHHIVIRRENWTGHQRDAWHRLFFGEVAA